MTVVVVVDEVLVFRFLGGGRARRRLLTIIHIITNIKMATMIGINPTTIDNVILMSRPDADAA